MMLKTLLPYLALATALLTGCSSDDESSPGGGSADAAATAVPACGGYAVEQYAAGDVCPASWKEAKERCSTPCTGEMKCEYKEAGDGVGQSGHCSTAVLLCRASGSSGDGGAGLTGYCGQ